MPFTLLNASVFQYSRGNDIEVKMNRVKMNLTLALLITGRSALATEAPATLEVITDGEPVAVLRLSDADAEVMTPACRGFIWEVLDAERGLYAPLAREPCTSSAPALPLDSEGMTLSSPQPPFYPAAVRAIALVGVGCSQGVPFEIAGCEEVFTVVSSPHTIQAPSDD